MKWILFVLITIIAFLLVICYALLAIASDEDERAEKMYEEWKRRRNEIDRR